VIHNGGGYCIPPTGQAGTTLVEVQQPGISLRHGKEGGGRTGSARISSVLCGQLQSGGGIPDLGDNMFPEVRSL
jgi:hypothetical protein